MAAAGRPPDPALPESISVLLVGSSDLDGPLASAAPADGEVRVTETSRGRDAYQWLTTQPGRVDCVVCAYDLPDMTGISLLETVRAADPDLPFVLVADDGSEGVASRAINADVTEYVPVDGAITSLDPGDLYDRIRRAVADARSTRAVRRRARQFDSRFDDAERYMWVLDPDGTIRRGNRTASGLVEGTHGTTDPDETVDLDEPDETTDANEPASPDGPDETNVTDRPFWECGWWADADDTRATVRNGVEAALAGEVTRAEVTLAAGLDETALDLTIQPVTDGAGSVDTVVVEGVDISERTELEQELRESEELHRVTLNNMTDTVLVTDDDGRFTYICPNVHFIFGYSVEELRELGTIEALLGDDLFDRDRLDDEGVLTNIETTATDKAGREHTLLVNVRQVSIQDGTILYSCRDITKRKERERALAALQRTSRDLLYAETSREIARHVVEEAVDILDRPGTAVYLFDSDENVLQPAARSDELARLHGPLSSISPREDSIVSHAFVEQTAQTYRDVHDSPRLHDPATDVRGAMVIPLGDHGVFVVASGDVDDFDDITEEIADLLAATAEAALDRVEREVKLRQRDRELQRQNQQLTQLNRTNEIIRDIDQLLVNADSREEIEHAVCERLTVDDRFELAWIGAVDESETVQPRAWAGSTHGYLDAIDRTISGDETEPALRTARSHDPTVVANVGEDLQAGTWRKAALSRGYQSVASVPLEHEGFAFGILGVYATKPAVFDETTRTVLYELGETIASAIRAAERKTALMSDTVTELEYRITDSQSVLYALAETANCSVQLEGGAHPSPDGTRVLVTVDGAPTEAVVRAAEEMVAIEAVRPIVTSDAESVLQLAITSPFVGTDLGDHGAALHTFTATPEGARVTIDVPQSVDTRAIDDLVGTRFPESELVAQRDRDRSLMTERQFRAAFLESITDRQFEVVQTAYFGGYFDSPRRNSGEVIAETLDISSSAFYTHVRNVQATLFETLFDEAEPTATPVG